VSTLPRLTRALATSPALAARGVVIPPDPAHLALPEKAVQFGTGAFLRGFVDCYLDEANRDGLFGGRVVAIGSTGSGRDDALREQDGLYTVATELDADDRVVQEYRIVSAVSRALSASQDWDAVLALARAPELELIFSNTTEVGIQLDPADADAPVAPHVAPRSFPGKLARVLIERGRTVRWADERGVVVVPCELIPDNGRTLRALVRTQAARWGTEPEFFAWLDRAVPFCDTLVDRIVPGTPRGAALERLRAVLGYDDALLTSCEPYRLFAIEWPAGAWPSVLRERLAFLDGRHGALITDDIAPYRERKVRLLNGAHTILAPLGLLLGCETVRDAVRHPSLGRLVRTAMLDEIAPVVEADGAEAFGVEVLARFANPHIRHALVDVTLQGTMKLRVRVIPAIVRYVQRTGAVPASLAFGFAGFLHFMRGELHRARRDAGAPLPADDHAAALREPLAAADVDRETLERTLRQLGRDERLWGTDLTALPGFLEAVTDHLWRIRTLGVRDAIDHHLASAASARCGSYVNAQ